MIVDGNTWSASTAILARPHSSGPSVRAGETLSRGSYGVREGSYGTAGPIVTISGQNYVVTAAHVLGGRSLDPHMQNVYAPSFDKCPGVTREPIGMVVNDTLMPLGQQLGLGHDAWGVWRDPADTDPLVPNDKGRPFVVDAALISLVTKDCANVIEDLGLITSLRPLRQSVTAWATSGATGLPQLNVQKYGHATKLTHGTLAGLATLKVKDVDYEGIGWVLAVTGAATNDAITTKLEVDETRNDPAERRSLFLAAGVTASLNGNKLTVTSHPFSLGGDSGAPVLDNERKLIGLVQGGREIGVFVVGQPQAQMVRTNTTYVMFIDAVQAKLGFNLAPAAPTSGQRVFVPGTAVELRPRAAGWEDFERARAAFEQTTLGARLMELARRYAEEVIWLVHHRRRATVTWHRHKGPAFLAAAFRGASEPGWPFPSELDGVALADALQAVLNVLLAEGSSALKASIAEYGNELLGLARRVESTGALLTASGDHLDKLA